MKPFKIYSLTNQNIVDFTNEMTVGYEANGLERRCITERILLLEDIAISYKDAGDKYTFSYKQCRKGKNYITEVVFFGKEHNPFEEDNLLIGKSILDKLNDKEVTYRYKNGENIITISTTIKRPIVDSLLFLWKYIRMCKSKAISVSVLQLLLVAMEIVIPLISALMVVSLTNSEPIRIVVAAAALLVSYVIDYVMELVSRNLCADINSKVMKSIESELGNTAMHLEKSCFDDKGSGFFIQRMSADVDGLIEGMDDLILELPLQLKVIGTFLACIFISPLFALYLTVETLIIFFLERARARKKMEDDRIYRRKRESYVGLVNEIIRAVADVKLLNAENKMMKKLGASIEKNNDSLCFLHKHTNKMNFSRKFIKEIIDFIFIAALALFLGKGWLSASFALIIYNYKSVTDNEGYYLESFINGISAISVSAERIDNMLNSKDFHKEKFGTKHLEKCRGDIEFRKVQFAYPNNPKNKILNGLSFTVKAGQKVAIMGKSGAGKSTILSLISKLYSIESGSIMLDGVDINDLDAESIRNNISVVTQFPYIFNDTIKENLMLANEHITWDEVVSACKTACIYDEIMNMKDGFDTYVGEGGSMLSGGQRQRLALARCIIKKSRVILLDEATSALDSNTQLQVSNAINNISKSCTVIIVAHRISTISDTDIILLIENGKVVAEGTQKQLKQKFPQYMELCD